MALKYGFAQGVITPVPGHVYLDGYGSRIKPAEGVHDELYVKVCAIEDNDKVFALMSFDVLGFTEDIEAILLSHITYQTGLPRERIMLCATHTHSSLSCGTLGGTPVNHMAWDIIGEKAGYAVKAAIANLEECSIQINMGKPLQSIINRRTLDDTCDRRVHVLSVRNAAGELKGVITSAACHAVIRTNYDLSADYPGVLTREAAKKYPGVPFMFLQGRCADTNPMYMGEMDIDSLTEKLGGELCESVFGAIEGGTALDSSCAETQFARVDMPVLDYPGEDELKEKIKKYADEYYGTPKPVAKRIAARILAWHEKALRYVQRGEVNRPMHIPLQTLKLGKDCAFIFMPFETLKITGDTLEAMLMERGYKSESIFVIGHSNCVFGYLAPKAYLPDQMPNSPWIYELTEAPFWYDTPQFCNDSEDFVIGKVTELIDK